jgi:hypothetical protein
MITPQVVVLTKYISVNKAATVYINKNAGRKPQMGA